ncbi:MAG: hypothetical protein NVS1B3_04660 [Candidatus Dormibacteraceae bacterium]
MLALVAGAACGGANSKAASSSRTAAASPKASPSLKAPGDKLDPEVAMPPGFPADVPIYPGARLTAAAAFGPAGQMAWGMEWETLDSVDKVQAFYSTKLSQGDWSIQFKGNANASFAATFSRKSNPKSMGSLGADGSSGVTKISLSLSS